MIASLWRSSWRLTQGLESQEWHVKGVGEASPEFASTSGLVSEYSSCKT